MSRYSEIVSRAIVEQIKIDPSIQEPELLNAITKPLTTKILQLDRNTLDLIAKNETKGGETLIKHICKKTNVFSVELNTTTTVIQKCKLN